jgi:hypothetical protein
VDRTNALKTGVSGVTLNDTTLHLTAAADDDGGSTNTPDWFWANPGNRAAQDVLTSLTGEFFK